MKCRVLIADDDPDTLSSVIASMRNGGAEVVGASSGAELLERLAEDGTFDLVITDISMPWMTGLEVARSLRDAGLDVPVILMTGLASLNLEEQVRALGGRAALLRKPFGGEELEDAVARMLLS